MTGATGSAATVITDNTLVGAGNIATPLSANYLNVKAFGATGDGSTDDRVAIQNGINAAASLQQTLFFPPGTYVVSRAGLGTGCLNLLSGVRILGENPACTTIIQQAGIAGSVSLFNSLNTVNCTIENITIDGNAANQSVDEHRHGVMMTGTTGMTLLRLYAQNFTGDGWYFYTNANNSRVHLCSSINNKRNGMTLGGGGQTGCVITDSIFTGSAAQQIDSEAAGVTQDITISGCLLDGLTASDDYVLTISGGSGSQLANNWSVMGNEMNGSCFCVWAQNITIANNYGLNASPEPSVFCYRVGNNNKIVGNAFTATQSSSPATGVIQAVGTSTSGEQQDGLLIANNTVVQTYFNGNGIVVQAVEDVTIANNVLRGAGVATVGDAGIYIRATITTAWRNCTVIGNDVKNFGQLGLSVNGNGTDAIDNLTVCNNTFDDDAGSMTIGMSLDHDSSHAAVNVTCCNNTCTGGVVTPIATYPSTPMAVGGGARGARGVYSCVGSPEAVITDAVGAMATRRDGGAGTTLYVKESGTGNTGWIAK